MKMNVFNQWSSSLILCFSLLTSCGLLEKQSSVIRPCTGYHPKTFVVNGMTYKCDDSVEVPEESIGSFYAYLVNACDEQKWREFDNDDTLVYIVDRENGVISADNIDMDNRFKVYSIKGSLDLALDLKGWYITCFYLPEV